MSNWTRAELARIATADDLHISPFREDAVTLGTPTWIWSVVVDDGLYENINSTPVTSWIRNVDVRAEPNT